MAINENITAVERFAPITEQDALDNSVMTLRMSEFIEAVAL